MRRAWVAFLTLCLLLTAGCAEAAGAGRLRLKGSTSSYPTAIVLAGLQGVWNNQTTAGVNGTYTTHTPVNSPTLITGVSGGSINGTAGQPTAYVTLGAGTVGATYTDWDFTGWNVTIDGSTAAKPIVITDAMFQHTGATSAMFGIGTNGSGTAVTLDVVTCNYCTFDGAGQTDGFESPVKNWGTLTLNHTKHINGVRDYVTTVFGTLTMADGYVGTPNSYFYAACPVPASGAGHAEAVHFFSGVGTITNTFFDSRAGSVIYGNWTGPGPYVQSVRIAGFSYGNTNVTMNTSIVIGGEQLGCNGGPTAAAMQVVDDNSVDPHWAKLTIGGSVLQIGSSQYIVYVAPVSGSGIIDTGSNRRYLDGNVIVLTQP